MPTVPVTFDEDVLKVAEFVNKSRLSQPYTEVGPRWEDVGVTPDTRSKGNGHNLQRFITIDGKPLHRPIHGLAHTMRTLAYSHLMHTSAQLQPSKMHVCADGRTLADLTPEQLKKINIAQLFFVAGRESEASYGDAYHRYHYYGAKLFTDFATEHLQHLFTKEEIKLYARGIADAENDRWDAAPETYMMHLCHMVDLMRCKSPVEVFLGHTDSGNGIVPNLIATFGKEHGLSIMHYARGLFAATGEGVPYIDSTEWPHLGASSKKVERAQALVGALQADGVEADKDKTAAAGFSVGGCYTAFSTVNTPTWYREALEAQQLEEALLESELENLFIPVLMDRPEDRVLEAKEEMGPTLRREVVQTSGEQERPRLQLVQAPVQHSACYRFFRPLIEMFCPTEPEMDQRQKNRM